MSRPPAELYYIWLVNEQVVATTIEAATFNGTYLSSGTITEVKKLRKKYNVLAQKEGKAPTTTVKATKPKEKATKSPIVKKTVSKPRKRVA